MLTPDVVVTIKPRDRIASSFVILVCISEKSPVFIAFPYIVLQKNVFVNIGAFDLFDFIFCLISRAVEFNTAMVTILLLTLRRKNDKIYVVYGFIYSNSVRKDVFYDKDCFV